MESHWISHKGSKLSAHTTRISPKRQQKKKFLLFSPVVSFHLTLLGARVCVYEGCLVWKIFRRAREINKVRRWVHWTLRGILLDLPHIAVCVRCEWAQNTMDLCSTGRAKQREREKKKTNEISHKHFQDDIKYTSKTRRVSLSSPPPLHCPTISNVYSVHRLLLQGVLLEMSRIDNYSIYSIDG